MLQIQSVERRSIEPICSVAEPEGFWAERTRSGKIMRRILRKIAEGDESSLGAVFTLLNPEVVELVRAEAGQA